jgi:DNA-binding LacI/PurR family transcriptional regulator
VLSCVPEQPIAGIDFIDFDEVKAARMAVDYLAAQGHRRIATVTGPRAFTGAMRRLRGYREGLIAHDLPVDPDLIVDGDYWRPSGAAAVARLLQRRPLPDAIFAANDLMALGALEALRQAGVGVPDDIAVVGFDDIPEAEIVFPQLTTIRQPALEIGKQAGLLILRRLGNLRADAPEEPAVTVCIEPLLVRRQSA